MPDMRMRWVACLAVPLALAAVTIAQSTPPSTTPSSKTVWDGVYTAEQAARGKTAYNTHCARCHGEKLMGNDDATPLVEKKFLEKWYGKSVGELVELTRKEMPSDGPGKLTRKQCTDMTAYLLSANGFPAGKTEMAAELDALNSILIQPKK